MPEYDEFAPVNSNSGDGSQINLTVDEYETIRLIDLEGYNQEECAKQMNVARTTVQGIYVGARKKIAEFLVQGKTLSIYGGQVKICNGDGVFCDSKGCTLLEEDSKIERS